MTEPQWLKWNVPGTLCPWEGWIGFGVQSEETVLDVDLIVELSPVLMVLVVVQTLVFASV